MPLEKLNIVGYSDGFGDAPILKIDRITVLGLILLIAFGISAVLMSSFGESVSWHFLLAFYPLIVILFGVALLKQSGLRMAFVGLTVTLLLTVFEFDTSFQVAAGAAVYGFIKSFGISISVTGTMFMIFLMKEVGALETISRVIKRQVVGNEAQALYIGIGFGSFLSSLGVVTPALFPPLLVAMGFSPTAAIAIAVLGYDPTTSFSLLSIPITLPAQIGGLNALELAFKVAIFLPLVSVGFAFAILWVVGGKQSMRRGAAPAAISGMVLALACICSTFVDFTTGVEYIPLRIIGVVGGLCAMLSLYAYQKLKQPTATNEKGIDHPSRNAVLRSFSPWIILAVLATIVSVPQIGAWLSSVPGNFEKITVFANQTVDLDVLSQIYTWIFVAIMLSFLTLRPSKVQVQHAAIAWLRKFAGPFLSYSLYFSISFVMAYSAMQIVGGNLMQSASYATSNMNVILGTTLAAAFGTGYIFVAAYLGLFGAVVGGSETSSNVLFLNIQKTAATDVGLNNTGFMTIYGSHAVAGGIASAITPAKINNAVVTIDESHAIESTIMRKHLIIAILLTIATGILTGVFVNLGI